MGRLLHFFRLLQVVQKLGFRSCFFYLIHKIKLRTGFYRLLSPSSSWSKTPPSWAETAVSPFNSPDLLSFRKQGRGEWKEEAVRAVFDGERILTGSFLFFSTHWKKRSSNWKTSPLNEYLPRDRHWSTIPDFNAEQGDIKWIWELSRFDWVFQLARAWVFSGDERFVEGFWLNLQDWRDHNPPNQTINWKCGQECALRLLALCWAGGVFRVCVASNPCRMALLWETVAALAERIEVSTRYAWAQNNNHALSEYAGLYIAGTCLERHPKSSKWKNLGKKKFGEQILRQFEVDGSYIQHSFNYTRMALQLSFVCLWVAQKMVETPFESRVFERLKNAVKLLFEVQDQGSGFLPNYGANDGSNIFALSGCSYANYRPLIQSLTYLLENTFKYPFGPHDESLLWYFGANVFQEVRSKETHSPVSLFSAESGGYYVLREEENFGMIRCHSYKTRPGHADLLHLDLWWKGKSLTLDPGTFQYYSDSNWGDYFKSTRAHNTLSVDGKAQMVQGSRFLWLEWTKSKVLDFRRFNLGGNRFSFFSGEHYGFNHIHKGLIHRRSIYSCSPIRERAEREKGGDWLIVDDLFDLKSINSTRSTETVFGTQLNWLLNPSFRWKFDLANRLTSQLEGTNLILEVFNRNSFETQVMDSIEDYPLTAQSLHYGEVSPALRIQCNHFSQLPQRWITYIGAEPPLCVDQELNWRGMSIPLQLS